MTTYTAEGNIETKVITGSDIKTLTTTYTYTDDNKFKASEMKTGTDVSLSESWTYSKAFGLPLSYTDSNGLKTEWQYNSLGQKRRETRPDGSTTKWYYNWTNKYNSLYSVSKVDIAQPFVAKYYDSLDREVESVTTTSDGRKVYKRKIYNSKGELATVVLPAFNEDGKKIEYTYDTYRRLIKTVSPSPTGGYSTKTTKYTYANAKNTLIITETDSRNNNKKTTKNGLGQITYVVDKKSDSTMKYSYNADGELLASIDNRLNKIKNTYDTYGRKIATKDGDSGETTYAYDVWGNISSKTDARGIETTYTYDALGRVLTKKATLAKDRVGKTLQKDSTFGYAKDKLSSVSTLFHYNDIYFNDSKSYGYDELGRLKIETIGIGSDSNNVITYEYNNKSRITKRYIKDGELGYVSLNHYVYKNGYLYGLKLPYSAYADTSNQPYSYNIESMDALGHVTKERYGNNVVTNKTYNNAGYLKKIVTTANLQNLEYIYDSMGNTVKRNDKILGINESFSYDEMSRIIRMRGNYGANYSYDSLGNLLSKGNITGYSYATSRPHAVTSANGISYGYDASGNMITRGNENLYYDTSNRAFKLVNKDQKESYFYYDANGDKIFKESDTENTLYLGNYYERTKKEVNGQIVTEYKTYHHFGDKIVVMSSRQKGHGLNRYHFHTDALDSVVAISAGCSAGTVERRSYQPFGEMRQISNAKVLSHKGFTSHEKLDELEGLIHMKGRIYDSTIGRFTSADIHIPHPYSTQSFNRYSYVRNNPLGWVDPSGYTGVEVNAAQAIEHEVQKIKSAPETLRTEGDHTPSPNKIDQLARQQVMINNPQLFTSEAKGQTYLIDVAPSFFEEGIGYTLGSMTDGIFAYFNDGYNPITNHMLNNQELLDTKVMGLFGFALPEVRFLRFGKGVGKVPHKNSLDYVGETHVYRIKSSDGTFKIGESAQGLRKGDGASIRAEQQARKLTRETGKIYKTKILKTFPNKRSGREYETNVIKRFRSIYGEGTLIGNKGTR